MNLKQRREQLQQILENRRDELLAEIVRIMQTYQQTPGVIASTLVILEEELLNQVDLLSDVEELPYEIYFQMNEDEPYDPCLVEIKISFRDFYYLISIEEQGDWAGYCMCTEEDPSYDSEHRCCGISCDWYRPEVTISRVELISCTPFKGLQRDYWKAKQDFIEKYLN